MKRYNTAYYIKEGVSSIFSHGFMSFASVCIIIACLIIMGSFSLLAMNVNSIIDKFEDDNVVVAYIDKNLSDTDARALQAKIEALPNVENADFESREDAMKAFEGRYSNKDMFENIDATVFRHRFHVYLRDISLEEQTAKDITNIDGISKVIANFEITRGLVTVRNIVSGVSYVLVGILLVISLFIMSNTIKLATFDRRDEIAIMKMVGATNKFIRWPFVFQGFILGIIGALTAFLAQWVIYTVVVNMLLKNNPMTFITAIPFSSVAVGMFAIFTAIGFGVGVGGSAMAIRNYLRV